MGLNDRQEDVTEFFVKLLENFDEDLTAFAEVFNLPDVFLIYITSTIFCHHCSQSSVKTEFLSVLTLLFPTHHNEEAADSVSEVLDITSLMDRYLRAEIIPDHKCSCSLVGGTERKLNIINAPQLLVIHLGRFTNLSAKIFTFVKFTT